MFSRKLKIGFLIALAASAVFFLAGKQNQPPVSRWVSTPELAEVFNLAINFGAGASKSFELAADGSKSLLQIMKTELPARGLEIVCESYAGLGELVSQIDGYKSGGGKYWQYWVNGEYAQTGADGYIARPGDKVEWKLTE